ncbi:MAG TPA: sugar nucleotide-binding protein, partial [Sphingomonas sp.]|nr:sugar nucleotide-binding protein [Sphingomonas sp.]
LADAVIAVAQHLVEGRDARHRGVFHATGGGDGTWASLAEAVFAASAANGGPSARVKHITTADYPTPARRPRNSRLDCTALFERHGVRLPDWRIGVAAVTTRLLHEKAIAA